tara:strand:+ start:846 stop:1322 length:477 start_codon:yes stop_codon:yes gene_type:complete
VSDQNHEITDSKFLKGGRLNNPTFLHEILLETKEYYQKLSSGIQNYQLRHLIAELSKERLYLIRSMDRTLTLNPEISIAINKLKLTKTLLCIINNNAETISNNNEYAALTSIIKCEKEILTLVKSMLMEARQQPMRNLLSALAASIQIGLDKLEQLET